MVRGHGVHLAEHQPPRIFAVIEHKIRDTIGVRDFSSACNQSQDFKYASMYCSKCGAEHRYLINMTGYGNSRDITNSSIQTILDIVNHRLKKFEDLMSDYNVERIDNDKRYGNRYKNYRFIIMSIVLDNIPSSNSGSFQCGKCRNISVFTIDPLELYVFKDIDWLNVEKLIEAALYHLHIQLTRYNKIEEPSFKYESMLRQSSMPNIFEDSRWDYLDER